MKNQQMINRIRKLMQLADESKNDSMQEVQAAIDKAHGLMREHDIDIADVLVENSEHDWDMVVWESEWLSQINNWEKYLCQAFDYLFSVKWWCIRTSKANNYKLKICFGGTETDVAVAVEAFTWLRKKIQKMARQDQGPGWTFRHRSYAEGFAHRIAYRARDMRESEEDVAIEYGTPQPEAAQRTDEQKYALVLQSKKTALGQLLEDQGVVITKARKPSGATDMSAMARGMKDGDEVNLNFDKGLKAGKTPEQLNG